MKLDGSYEFSELTQVEGVFVSSGKERASGKIIQIHLFPAAKAEQANRICQRLLALTEAAQKMILKYGQEGSASYFVTEPLPAGEYLQSWVERQISHGPATQPAPEVSGGLTDQLRHLGIRPSPLAPMMPGPERRAPATPPDRPGELTREFRSLYGQQPGDGRGGDPVLPPPPAFPAEPPSRPAAAKTPGLETWLNLDSAAVRETPEPVPPSPPAPAAAEPPRRNPPSLAPESARGAPGDFTRNFRSLYGDAEPDTSFVAGDSPAPTPLAPQPSRVIFEPAAQAEVPVYAPPPPPAFPPAPAPQLQPMQHVSPLNSPAVVLAPKPTALPAPKSAPKPASPALDWKMILLVAGALMVLAGAIVAMVEMSSS
jgi:hypothetical protein